MNKADKVGAAVWLGMALLVGCAEVGSSLTTVVASPAGQLFCALTTGNGTTVAAVQTVVDMAAGALGPDGTLAAMIVTGQADSVVQNACAAAAAATGAQAGLPVSPPPVPSVAPVVTIPLSVVAKAAGVL